MLEVASGMGTCGVPSIGAPMKAMTLSEGQIIIANQIQICEPEDALNLSMSQSTTSSSDTSTNNEWLGSAPVVAWPLSLASLVEQAKPADSTMVMPMMPPTPPPAMAEATATGAAISMYCDYSDSSSFSGKQQSTKDLTTTTGITTTTISSFNSSSASSNNNSMLNQINQLKNTKIAKRVHFWDAHHHQQHAGQTATAADGAGNVVVVSVGSVAF